MKQEIVIFSLFQWSSNLMHREHMLARSLSRMGYKVTFVERVYIKPGKSYHRSQVRICSNDGIKIITLASFPYIKGRSKTIYKLNDKLLTSGLKDLFNDINPEAWLICTNPNWVQVIKNLKKKSQTLAYDMSDDMPAFATNEKWRKELEVREQEMLKVADTIFVTSKNLLPKTKGGKNARLIENGVDLEAFKNAKPILKKKFSHPIAGYIGGIFDWVDLSLIKKSAELNPEIDFVLVGPTNKQKEVAALAKASNVHYLGEINWQEVGDYFASLDVGLLPFVSEEKYPRLKTADSGKIYQYAYFGYPIISTDFSQVRALGNIVTVCKTEKDFILATGITGKEGDKNSQVRRDFAKNHSWEKQSQKIISSFQEIN